MSNILVFIQQENGKLNSASLASVKAATELKAISADLNIIGVALGTAAKQSVQAVKCTAISKFIVSEDPTFDNFIAYNYADALRQAALANNVKYIIGASTSSVKDFFPALTAMLEDSKQDCAMVSEVLKFITRDTFLRPMYAGNVIAEVLCNSDIKVISVRATNFSGLLQESVQQAEIEDFAYSNTVGQMGKVLNFESSASERPELTDAKIVVSGGRGVQSKEGFEKYIYPLADALGAAIGASRAAVDAGFAPNDWQVGQTGKTVAPQLYIAVGLSGAIQHLAGMKDSRIVVAINKDPEAPIFEVADYGLVADLEKAVPELIEKIKA